MALCSVARKTVLIEDTPTGENTGKSKENGQRSRKRSPPTKKKKKKIELRSLGIEVPKSEEQKAK